MELIDIAERAVHAFVAKRRATIISTFQAAFIQLRSIRPFYKLVRKMMLKVEKKMIEKVGAASRIRRPPLATIRQAPRAPLQPYYRGRENNEDLYHMTINSRQPGEARHITERGIGVGWYG